MENISLDGFVIKEFSNLLNFLFTLLVIFIVAWCVSYIATIIIFKVYDSTSSDDDKSAIRELIYHYDKFSDTMSNKEKKKEVVNSIRDIFSWRGIRIPAIIVGWIIDMEVASIRKLQKQCKKETNLHPDDCDGDCSNHEH